MKSVEERKGPWSASEIERFLEETRVPVRVACHGASGFPMLVSLWFIHREGRLWCATKRTSHVAERLASDPRCAFEISLERPPYRGVRGTARASLHDERGEEMLRALIDRYLGNSNAELASRLLSQVAEETAIAIDPQSLVSWDFRGRMEEVS